MKTSKTSSLSTVFLFFFMNVIAGCTSDLTVITRTDGMSGSAGRGLLTGKVMRGPTSPVGLPDKSPEPEPAPGIRLLILTKEGQQIDSAVTDEQGAYRTSLPAGAYRIETTGLTGLEFTKSLPAIVTIHEDQETHLDVYIDTGIR